MTNYEMIMKMTHRDFIKWCNEIPIDLQTILRNKIIALLNDPIFYYELDHIKTTLYGIVKWLKEEYKDDNR